MGFGLKNFIKRVKLEEAAQQLKYTNQSVLEISGYLCFSSQSNFQNAFKCQYGCTPKQYREAWRARDGYSSRPEKPLEFEM